MQSRGKYLLSLHDVPSILLSDGCLLYRYCIYVLHGHTSTVRSLRVLHNRPIAVSGSRDSTLRVWDIQRGKCLRVLAGHRLSVKCLDVCGNRVASGSYDNTCRVSTSTTRGILIIHIIHFVFAFCRLALEYRYWAMHFYTRRSSSSDILCCFRWCKNCLW